MSSTTLIGADDAAKIVGVSRQAISRATRARHLRHIAAIGHRGTYVYDLEDVKAYAESRKAHA